MATYYVSSEIGNNDNAGTSATAPLATLQAASNLVKPGDTVEVMDGTYTGPAGLSVLDITTSGTASAPITFEAAPGQTPVINSSGSWFGIDVRASYIVINGFTVAGDAANYTLGQALAGYSTSNASLDGSGIFVGSPGGGVVPNHITIEGNTVYNEPGAGIQTDGADYLQILNNVIYGNAHWSASGNSGISIWKSVNSDTNPGVHDVVSGNLVFGNAQLVPTSGGATITDGEGIILDTNQGFVGEILVENNTVYGNGSAGLESFLTDNAVFTTNTVYGNDTGNVLPASDAEIFINRSNGVTVTNNTTTAPAATAWSVVGTGDFTGNGTSDVLLQNGGTVVDWLMQNGQYSSGNVLTTGASGWSVVGTGDFTGNGTDDVLLQNGGTVVDWIIQNGQYVSGNVLSTTASGWSVVGAGDFTWNGTDDVLLQNGGTVVDWIMENGEYANGTVISTAAAGWTVAGTGDYTGDGTSSVLLQNGGTVVDWILKNGQYLSSHVLAT
jgi:hypothetical protein